MISWKSLAADSFLDPGEVEDHDPVLFLRHHVGECHALLGVVAGREGVLALIVRIGVVEVAVNHHLPGDLHGIAIDRREDRPVLVRLVQDLAVVGDRHLVFAVAEDVAGARKLLQPHAMNRVLVGQLDDLVTAHDVQADPGDTGVGFVVDEEIPPVIGAVGERQMRMVSIAVQVDAALVRQERLGFGAQPFGENPAAFVGLSPSGSAAAIEHRDPRHLTHGRQTEDADLAALTTAEERVVIVELAGLQVRRAGALSGGGGRCRRQEGLADQRCRRTASNAGQARQGRQLRGAAEQLASIDGTSPSRWTS